MEQTGIKQTDMDYLNCPNNHLTDLPTLSNDYNEDMQKKQRMIDLLYEYMPMYYNKLWGENDYEKTKIMDGFIHFYKLRCLKVCVKHHESGIVLSRNLTTNEWSDNKGNTYISFIIKCYDDYDIFLIKKAETYPDTILDLKLSLNEFDLNNDDMIVYKTCKQHIGRIVENENDQKVELEYLEKNSIPYNGSFQQLTDSYSILTKK